MSIRPSQPLLTTLQGGVLTIEEQRKGKVRNLDLKREVYTEQGQAELAVSVTPAAYLRGIIDFLKNNFKIIWISQKYFLYAILFPYNLQNTQHRI